MVDRLKLELPTLGRKNDALDFLREFEKEEVHPYGTNHLDTITKEYGEFKSYEEWLTSYEKYSVSRKNHRSHLGRSWRRLAFLIDSPRKH